MTSPYAQPFTTESLNSEGELIAITFTRTSPTTGTLSWTIPTNVALYNGLVATLKTSPILPADLPVDGQRYSASPDLTIQNSVIGSAQVVGALYGDLITNSINVINLDPNAVYFASGHCVTNTLQYFTRGRQSYPLAETSSSYSGDIPEASTPPLNPSVGQVYYNTQLGLVWMWTGANWIEAGTGKTRVGTIFPQAPDIVQGQFFYNTITKILYVYTGTDFTPANTANPGLPMYEKLPGTDGSYNERAKLIQIIKRQLGWPSVCVELTEEHFEIAIDNALQEFRRRADNAYSMKYMIIPFNKNQDIYYLNNPADGTNLITDVVKIWRVSGLGLIQQGAGGVYGQSFLNYFYGQGVVDLTSIYLMNAYADQFSQIFAGAIDFRWYEPTRQLQLLRRLGRDERVLIEAMAERTEQELLVDRYATQWLQGWAVSEAKMTLGHIRSKYSTLPGAGGGTNLNGDALIQSATEDQTELLRQIMDFEVGNGGHNTGNYSFVIG
jgi:hypothetical protein